MDYPFAYTILILITGWALGLAALILGYLIRDWEVMDELVKYLKKDKPPKKQVEKPAVEKPVTGKEAAAAKKTQTQLFSADKEKSDRD